MKLNTKDFRYLTPDDWRVLVGVELGSKNHEVIPTPLITQLAGLRAGHSGANRSISVLAKAGLIAREKNVKYDGYRLTYGGLDYLALHSHTRSDAIIHLGSQMGVGKESDIYLVTSPFSAISSTSAAATATTTHSIPLPQHLPADAQEFEQQQNQPTQAILKIHRLGRISFRSIRSKRSYHGNRSHASWHYLSRLSAHKEYLCMRALHSAGFPVPTPIAWNRHTIVMSLVPGIPLRNVPLSAFELAAGGRRAGREPRDREIERLYGECLEMILKLAEVGVIHGDFNEFNILIGNVPDPDMFPDEEGDEDVEDMADVQVKTDKTHAEDSSAPPFDSATTSQSPTDTPPTTNPTSPPSTQPQPLPTPPKMIVHLIDFPQITSLSHPQASYFFRRDVECIQRFFLKRYHFTPANPEWPSFEDAEMRLKNAVGSKEWAKRRIDVEIEAAGFSRKMARELGEYFEQAEVSGEGEEGLQALEDEDEDEEDGALDGEDVEAEEEPQLETRENLQSSVDGEHLQEPTQIPDEPSTSATTEASNQDVGHDSEQADTLSNLHPANLTPANLTPANLTLLDRTAAVRKPADDAASQVSTRFGRMSMASRRTQATPRSRAKASAGWSI